MLKKGDTVKSKAGEIGIVHYDQKPDTKLICIIIDKPMYAGGRVRFYATHDLTKVDAAPQAGKE